MHLEQPMQFAGVHIIQPPRNLPPVAGANIDMLPHGFGAEILLHNESIPENDKKIYVGMKDTIYLDDKGILKNKLFINEMANRYGFFNRTYEPRMAINADLNEGGLKKDQVTPGYPYNPYLLQQTSSAPAFNLIG